MGGLSSRRGYASTRTSRSSLSPAEISFDWDATRRALVMPFQIISGGNRITLQAQLQAPREGGGTWGVEVSGGSVVLASSTPLDSSSLVLNRFVLRLRIDPSKQRVDIEQGELGNSEIGVALSGGMD